MRPKLPLPRGLAFGKEPATYVNEADGSELVYVPGGEYPVGSSRQTRAQPEHRVVLSAFFLGKLEVTWEQYLRFDPRHPGKPPTAGKDHPVTMVRWGDADAYCRAFGLRLPTEAEWEAAARGDDSRAYPWGNERPTARRLNCKDSHDHTTRVGSFPEGASPFGCLDMAGNVEEWCADWYGEYARGLQRNPRGPKEGKERVSRGGSFKSDGEYCFSAFRAQYPPDKAKDNVGFRVARSDD